MVELGMNVKLELLTAHFIGEKAGLEMSVPELERWLSS